MSTTFDWHVVKLICKNPVGNLSNVVHAVSWTVTGTMVQNGQTYTITEQGNASIPFNQSATFTEYGNLTEAQVLDWVYNSSSIENITFKSKIENKIQKTLNLKANPPVATIVTPDLPW